jgi:hypothetical protein
MFRRMADVKLQVRYSYLKSSYVNKRFSTASLVVTIDVRRPIRKRESEYKGKKSGNHQDVDR